MTQDTLESLNASQALSPFVSKFVHRSEVVNGQAVRLLPEMRMSVQIMLADEYWVREREKGSLWRRLPQISLWGPRKNWGYGYVKENIKVYAFVLTPAGFQALYYDSVDKAVNEIFDLSDFIGNSEFLFSENDETFQSWVTRMEKCLPAIFRTANTNPVISSKAVDILVSSERSAVSDAAEIEGISQRQFRRRFIETYGISPKLYQRVVRVDRMMQRLCSWSWEKDRFESLPLEFSDQPHKIREFRSIIGLSPKEYRERKIHSDLTLRSVAEPDIELPHSV